MSEKKKIIVACGTGVATSTSVMEKIKDKLNKEDFKVELYQCRVADLKSQIDSIGPDVVVCTTEVSINTDVPILRGIPYLTGIGIEDVNRQLIDILNNGGDKV